MAELRLALVLNGGVSLAVWMGGVTHEINRVRMASGGLGLAPMKTGPEDSTTTAWRAILELSERSVRVDLAAGTSAGGLNGAVLATAIACGRDLPDMRTTWVGLGDLGSLARFNPGAKTRSLLNGSYFSESVQTLMAQLVKGNMPTVLPAGECTLLTTATAIQGEAQRVILESGQESSTADSRRVYRFDLRTAASGCPGSGANDFADEDTLALAARASASFPFAFDPVFETQALRARRTANKGAGLSWLMDGGVLDNAPFEPLLDVLTERPVDGPFDRLLVYVTPGVSAAGPAPGPALELDWPQVLGAVLAATRESDSRLDRDRLVALFEAMGYASSHPWRVFQDWLTDAKSAGTYVAAAQGVFPRYCDGRRAAVAAQFAAGINPVLTPPVPAPVPDAVAGVPVTFMLQDSAWTFGVTAADRVLRWWGRALNAAAKAGADVPDATFMTLAEQQRTLTALMRELDEGLALGETPTQRYIALEAFYVQREQVIREALHSAALALTNDPVSGADVPERAAQLLQVSAAVEVLSSLHAWESDEYEAPLLHYVNITPATQVPDFLDLGPAGSAVDWPSKKLYGERWGHFGAFATRRGRLQDWRWGRVDAAVALSDLLLRDVGDKDRADELRQALIEAVVAEEDALAIEDINRGELAKGIGTLAQAAAEVSQLTPLGLLQLSDAPRTTLTAIWSNLSTLLPELTVPVAGVPAGSLLQAVISPKRAFPGYKVMGLKRKAILRVCRTAGFPLRRYLEKRIDRFPADG